MSDLDKRMRSIMRREKLSYQQVSDFADVSVQAVHKWLSSGNISDSKARVIAHNIGLDWVWLKHGINRLPMDTFYDIVLGSTANIIMTSWDSLEILAVGQKLQEQFEYAVDEVVGRSVLDFATKVKEKDVRRLQKLVYALSGMADYSYRVTLQDKHSSKNLLIRGRGTTTDNEGNTYALEGFEVVEANGTEDVVRSFKLHKKSPIPLDAKEAEEIIAKYSEYPWLNDFLNIKQ